MAQNVVSVPLVRLIVLPEKHHGMTVRITGFVRIEFEGNALYLHQEDDAQGLTDNGIWLDVPEALRRNAAAVNGKYGIVEGVFDAKHQGHMGLWSGTIRKITRMDVWSDPAKPRLSPKR